MVFWNFVSMMWSMHQMINIFENPPDFSKYAPEGRNSTSIYKYYNNSLGGPSFLSWAENGMKMPTAEWIMNKENTGFFFIKTIYEEDNQSLMNDVAILTRNLTETQIAKLQEMSKDDGHYKCCWKSFEDEFMNLENNKTIASRTIKYEIDHEGHIEDMHYVNDFVANYE